MSDQHASEKDPIGLKVIYILILLLAALIVCTLFLYKESIAGMITTGEVGTVESIIISEVCSSKSDCTSTLYDETLDWIELYNPSNQAVDLSDFYISDKMDDPCRYRLPEVMLESQAYIVVYASGYDVFEENEIHTNFKISAKGETILLSNKNEILATVVVPSIETDFSFGYGEDGTLGYLYPATPMAANGPAYATEEDYYSFICNPNGIYINEYMSKKQAVIYDEDGCFSDWVELVNTTDADVSLKGYCLTDDPYDPFRFVLPDVTIEKQSTLLIFLDGKDMLDESHIHANFSLSQKDVSLNLFDSGHHLIDTVEVVETDETVSYGRSKNDVNLWQYFDIPTPGQPNIFEGEAEREALANDYAEYVLINEVKTISASQKAFNADDWIELYNNADETINLAGFGLSDDSDARYKWVFPKGASISPGAYLLVFATGKNTVDAEGRYHTNFKLDAGMEEVYLSSNLGYIVDKMSARYVNSNHSIGKTTSGATYLLKTSTPGVANSENIYLGYAHHADYSLAAGTYPEAISLELSSDEASSEIYYTLDGTTPTSNSKKYTEPIMIKKNTTVSAIAIAPDKLVSETTCQSYLIGSSHDLPIVVITCETEYLNGSDGIFTHCERDKQVPATVEIIEPDNGGYISFDAKIELFGNTSLYAPQKSFAVEVDGEYSGCILYDLFPNDAKTVNSFGSFVLRNGGSSEWNRTKLTDAFLIGLARLGLNVDAQSYRPSAVYINGEYYGLLNIREKMNRDYIENKYGFEHDAITIVEPATDGDYRAVQGDVSEFMTLVSYIRKHDLSDQQHYDYIASKLDINNYIDSILVHIIAGNKDSGNIKFWKADIEDQKWRVFLFDLDRAAYYPSVNHLTQRTSSDGHGSGKLFDTSVIRGLLKNEEFSYQFYKRAIELIDTLYSPNFSTAYYNHLIAGIENEMENNLDIWWKYAYNDASPENAFGSKPEDRATAKRFILNEQNRHKSFLKTRQSYMLQYFKSYFHLSDRDIENLRQEIAEENKAPTQIYNAFIKTDSIVEAITLANQLDTVFRDASD